MALPPSITRVNPLPVRRRRPSRPSAAAGPAPRGPRQRDPGGDGMTPSRIDCAAARAAPSGSCSPMRRATSAVAPIDSPIASGVDHRHHRLGEPDGRDRVGAEMRDPEHVGDGEDRLHRHLHDHGDGEHDHGPADRGGRVVDADPANRGAERRPETVRERSRSARSICATSWCMEVGRTGAYACETGNCIRGQPENAAHAASTKMVPARWRRRRVLQDRERSPVPGPSPAPAHRRARRGAARRFAAPGPGPGPSSSTVTDTLPSRRFPIGRLPCCAPTCRRCRGGCRASRPRPRVDSGPDAPDRRGSRW